MPSYESSVKDAARDLRSAYQTIVNERQWFGCGTTGIPAGDDKSQMFVFTHGGKKYVARISEYIL